MGLSTEGHEEPREFTLPQNRPNRTSTYDMLMQSAPTVGNGDPAAEVPSRHRPQGSQDTKEIAAKDQEGTGRSPEETQDVAVKERVRQNGSVRPSERSRICGKCGGHLTGQFVRALGDTYHLECFTCHVRLHPVLCLSGRALCIDVTCRTAAKSSPRNSSLFQIHRRASTPFAKPTISADWTSSATLAEAP